MTTILSLFVVSVTAFIFLNSFADGEASSDFSNSIIDLLFLRKLLDNEIVQLVVRKAAHMIEFAGLGMSVMGLALQLDKNYNKRIYGVAFFYVLSVAVMDEHIQNFSLGRTSATSDILLDFSGSMIGFLTAYLFYIVIRKLKKGKHDEKRNLS